MLALERSIPLPAALAVVLVVWLVWRAAPVVAAAWCDARDRRRRVELNRRVAGVSRRAPYPLPDRYTKGHRK